MIAESVSWLWFDIVPSIDAAPAIMVVKVLYDNNETCDDVSEAGPLHW